MADDNKDLREARELLETLNRLRVQMNKEPLKLTDEQALRQLKSLPGDIRSAQKEMENFYGSASNLYDQLRSITSELKGQQNSITKSRGAFRKLEEAAQNLKLDEQDILDLNRDEVEKLQEKLERNEAIIAQEADRILSTGKHKDILADISKYENELLESNHSQGDQAKLLNDFVSERLKTAGNLSEEEKTILSYYYDQDKVSTKLNHTAQKRLELEDKISEKMGVTGALVQGTGALMERLGMRSGIFHDAMNKSAKKMREMAKDTALGAKSFSQLEIAAKGFSIVAKGFGKALTDPAVIIGKILDGFLKVDKAATEVQQITGQNSTTLVGFNNRLASSVDMLETMAELTKQTGMNAQNIFSPDVIAGAAELKNTMGLAADEAGGLAMIAQTTGGNIDATTDAIVDQTSAFNKANRSAVSQGQVLRDVAKTSDGIKASFAGMPGALANAAASARRLGMDLGRLDQIAGSLMDFESSIEAELEAQLLTGKNINMAKARELALNNDLAGLSKELFKNSSSIAEFGKMNRIQQEAQAKALGMSRDELGKIAYQRALETGMTEKQAAAAAGVRAEDMKRMAVQERLQKAVEKLAQAFAPMLEFVGSIAEGISFILTPIAGLINGAMKLASAFGQVGQLIMGATILGGVALLRKSLIQAFNPKITGNFFTHLKDNFKGIGKSVSGLKDKLKEAFSSKGSELTDKITKDAQGRFRDAKGRFAKAPVSEKLKESVTNKAKDKTSILKDKVKTKTPEGGTGVANKISKINATELLKGAAAMAVAAGAIYIFGKAVQELEKVEDYGRVAIGLGLFIGTLGATAAILYFAGPAMYMAAPALIAFGAAVTLFGIGLRIATPAIEAFGTVIQKALGGISGIITAAADGLSQILGVITPASVLALLGLGPALISAGAGLTAFSLASLFALPGLGVLGAIAAMADPLSSVGASLTAVAAGIGAMAVALNSLETEKLEEIKDLVMTTAFAAPMVAATGAITSMIQGISGGGDQSKSDPAMIEKLDAILSAIKEGGDVYIDGNKAGQSLMLAAVKSS